MASNNTPPQGQRRRDKTLLVLATVIFIMLFAGMVGYIAQGQ